MTSLRSKLGVAVLSVAVFCCGQEKDAALARKEASIRELLASTDARKIADQMLESMTGSLGSNGDPAFAGIWDSVAKRIDWTEVTELMVPIYAKHFTQEEIDAIVAFYKSPAGRQYLAKMPAIMQEFFPAYMEWSKKLQTMVKEEIEKEGK